MPKRVTTHDGDVLDELVWQHYGSSDVLAAVLEANPHLAQAAATAKGGAEADVLDLTGATIASDISAFTTGVLAGLEAVDATSTEFTGKDISLNSVKGVLTLAGTDKGLVDTLAEWLVVANLAAESANETVAFEFGGKTYVFQQVTPANVDDDVLVELTGVTGVTGVVLAGGGVAAAVDNIFII